MGSPVFGPGDRVPNNTPVDDGLPPELKGKTPAEIARFFTERENTLRAELDARPPRQATPPPSEPPAPTNTEFWNDPLKTTDARIQAKALSREEYDRVSAAIRPSLIWAAKQMVIQRHPDFHRVEREINDFMTKIPEWQHTDPVMWETVYVQSVGIAHERLAAEDRVKPPVLSAEPGGPGGTAPPPDADLYKVTVPGVSKGETPKSAGRVADLLGITHDQYRAAQKELAGDGLLPLTYDNRRSK